MRKGPAGLDNRKEPGSPTTSPMAGAAQAPLTPSVKSKKVRTDRLLFTRAYPQHCRLLSCQVRQVTILAMEPGLPTRTHQEVTHKEQAVLLRTEKTIMHPPHSVNRENKRPQMTRRCAGDLHLKVQPRDTHGKTWLHYLLPCKGTRLTLGKAEMEWSL